MKKIILLLFAVILSNSSFAQDDLINKTAPIRLTIESANKNAVKSNGLFIKVHFTNLGNETIKLLDLFDPEGIFLSMSITKEDRNTIMPSGFGKLDFGHGNNFKYIEIGKGQSYTKDINISERLKKEDILLPAGKYKIKISYHNKYGNDCIKGWFNSNEIPFVID